MNEKILIVDDDKDIVSMLDYNLKKEGFITGFAYNGEDAICLAINDSPDIIILDIMLKGIDGFEVCKRLKKDKKTFSIPIIMLTAKGEEQDKILGLELGTDDYVTKPFSIKELIARIKAILRRTSEKEKSLDIFTIDDLNIDFSTISVTLKNKPIYLTSKEFELLKTLIKAKGKVVSREYLLDTVWGFNHPQEIQSRTVDVHIRTLRKKLKNVAKYIITVKNYGYRFLYD